MYLPVITSIDLVSLFKKLYGNCDFKRKSGKPASPIILLKRRHTV